MKPAPLAPASSPRHRNTAARRGFALAALLALALLPLVPREAPAASARTQGLYPAMIPPDPYRSKEFTFVKVDGVFHVFWMRVDTTVDEDSTGRDIGHAVSTDLTNWTQLDPVLPVRPDKWDDFHVWSPSLMRSNGIWYMFYTGVTYVPYGWPSWQRIGVATSTDLVSWQRYDQPVYAPNQTAWAIADSSTFDGCQFRDPFVMPDPADTSRWLMYFTGAPVAARGQLLIGAASNAGGLTPWRDEGPLWVTDAAHYWGWSENPCLLQHAGLWYLFVTTTSGHPIGIRTAPAPLADSSLWSGKYRLWDMTAQSPASDDWWAPEVLSADGHDYLAFGDSDDNGIDFAEIQWTGPTPYFSLTQPLAAVDGAPAAGALGLRLLGRAHRGHGALLEVALPAAAAARVELFDVSGRRVSVLHDGALPTGRSVCAWDGRDAGGALAPCGVYFARLVTAAGRRTLRVVTTD